MGNKTNRGEYVIKISRAKMPSSCFDGCNYYRIAVMHVDEGVEPTMISPRARGVRQIVKIWESLWRGLTERCVYAVALRDAVALCDRLNVGEVDA